MGLFTGGLILLFALQIAAELIPLTIPNGGFESPVVPPGSVDERVVVDENSDLDNWSFIFDGGDVYHYLSSGDVTAVSQFFQINSSAKFRLISDLVTQSSDNADFVVKENDIIAVKFNQSGSEAAGQLGVVLLAVEVGDVDNYQEVEVTANVGFAGKSFGEDTVLFYQVPASSPLIDKNLRIAFKGAGAGSGRIDDVRVEVERPTISDDTIPALPKAVKLAKDGDKITVDYQGDFSDFEGIGGAGLNTMTFEAWVKLTGSEVNNTGIIFSRDGGAGSGMFVQANGELRYQWKNLYANETTGLTAASGKWTYLAVSVSPKNAVLYMYTAAGGWKSKVITKNHDKIALKALLVGADEGDIKRTFKGDIAEARVWDLALTETQLKYNMSRINPDVYGVRPLIHYNFDELTTAADGTAVANKSRSKYPATISSTGGTVTDFVLRSNSVNFAGGGKKFIKVGDWSLTDPKNLASALQGADKDRVNIAAGAEWTTEFYIKRFAEGAGITDTHLTYGLKNVYTGLRLSAPNKVRRVGLVNNGNSAFDDAFAPVAQWSHYVYVRTAAGVELFIDGVSYGVRTDVSGLTFRSIGSEAANCPEMELRAVRVWKKALTPNEIKDYGLIKGDLFPLNVLEGNADLALYYDFNQLPGGKLVDLSSSNLGGELQGFADPVNVFLPTVLSTELTASVSNVSSTKATINWSDVPGAYEYVVEYAENSDFLNSKFVTVQNATSVELTLEDLRSYYARVKVRSVRTAGRIDYADSFVSSRPVFFNMPVNKDHIEITGKLVDDGFKLIAGEGKSFSFQLKDKNGDPITDFNGKAKLTLTNMEIDGSGKYGRINVDKKGYVDIITASFEIDIEVEKGASKEVVVLAFNNVLTNNVTATLEIDSVSYDSTTLFVGWKEFDISPASPGSITVDRKPDGVPGTVNGGLLSTQPQLTVKDAFGNKVTSKDKEGNIVREPVVCHAKAADGSDWHIGGGTLSSYDGTFTYSDFSIINGTENLIASDDLIVVFSVEGTGVTQNQEIKSATVQGAQPAPGKSLIFDGSRFVSAGEIDVLDSASSVTYAAWFKVDEFVANAGIIQRRLNDANQMTLGLGSELGSVRVKINGFEKSVPSLYELGEWVYVAAVYEFDSNLGTAQVNLYINNSANPITYSNVSAGGVVSLPGTDLVVGANGSTLFKGEIDEVKVTTAAIDVAKSSVYAEKGDAAGLLVYYKFDQSSESATIVDLSTSANHGMVLNAGSGFLSDSFAMGCPVTLPATDINGSAFTGNWAPATVVGAESFDLEVSSTSDFTVIVEQERDIDAAFTSKGVAGNSLSAGTYYYYRAVSNFSGGQKRYSVPVVFLTQINGFKAPGNGLHLREQTSGTPYDVSYAALNEGIVLDNDWTIQAWVKPAKDDVKQILFEGETSEIVSNYINSFSQSTVALLVDGVADAYEFGVTLPKDVWTHVTFVRNSEKGFVTLYMNGKIAARITADFNFKFTALSAAVDGFDGEIDELAVWSKVLREEQVKNTLFLEKTDFVDYKGPGGNDDIHYFPMPEYYYSFDLSGTTALIRNIGSIENSLTVQSSGNLSGDSFFVSSSAWDIPVAFPASNVTTSGFTANWRSDKARKVNVFISPTSTVDGNGNLVDAVKQESNSNSGWSQTFTSYQPGETLYYQVAYDGGVKSEVIQTFTSVDEPGNCMQFGVDQGGCVNLPKLPILRGDKFSNFTLEAWVLSTGEGDENAYVGIIGSDALPSIQPTEPVVAPTLSLTGEKKSRVQYGFGVDWGKVFFATSDEIIEPYQWTHLAVTFDGSKMTLYKNGIEVDSLDGITEGPSDQTHISFIGKRTNGSGGPSPSPSVRSSIGSDPGYFNGMVDEVRIWSVAVSSDNILKNYRDEVEADSDGLVAYYRFNKSGDATEVADLTGNGANGSYSKSIDSGSYTPWKQSYALVAPEILNATNIDSNGFTVNWKAPKEGGATVPTEYLLYVSADSSFSSFIPGYNPKKIEISAGDELSEDVTVAGFDKVYYKLSAVSDAVNSDSGYAADVDISSLSSATSFVFMNKVDAPGNALKFDGIDDYISLPQRGALAVKDKSFSVEFWLKNDFLRSEDRIPKTIIGNRAYTDGTENGWYIGLGENGKLRIVTRKEGATVNALNGQFLADSQWHHVAVVFDRPNDMAYLYIDGSKVQDIDLPGSSTDAFLSNSAKLTIGADTSRNSTRYFGGWLDELRVWKKALSASEVADQMNNELFYANLPAELALYYQFDESANFASVLDLTEDANHGTMHNFADKDLDFVWQDSAAMGAPGKLDVSEVKTDSFKVNWVAPITSAVDSYRVEVATDETFTTLVPLANSSVSSAVNSYSVSGLSEATVYYVRVTALSAGYNEGKRESETYVVSTEAALLPGKAVQFDGVDDYVVVSPKRLLPTNRVSFSAWVKLESGTLAGMTKRAVLFHTLANEKRGTDYLTVYLEPNGKLSCRWNTSQLRASSNAVKIVEDQWTHVAVTLGAGQAANSNKEIGFYMTPVNTGTTVVSYEDINTNSTTLYGTSYIGGISSGTPTADEADNFKGLIDDVQVLTKTLQLADVETLSRSYVDNDNPVAGQFLYLPFNESAGVLTGDLANERYAELVNGAARVDADYLKGEIFVKPAKTLVEDGFILQWEAVDGASSYEVKVYTFDGTEVTGTPGVTVAVNGTEAVVSGLEKYGQYQYEITVQPSGKKSGRKRVTTGSWEKVVTPGGTFYRATPGYAVRMEYNSGYLSGRGSIFGEAPDEFTVEFWCKPEAFVNRTLEISSIDDTGAEFWKGFTFYTDANAWLYTGTTSADNNFRIVEKQTPFSYIGALEVKTDPNSGSAIGKEPTEAIWQHIAVTFNRGLMNVYRDGRLISSKSGIPGSRPWNGLSIKNFGGALDELRVWSKELSIAEVNEQMHTTVSPDSEFLKAYYRFDQRTLDNGVPDLAGNAALIDVSNPKPEVRASYAMVRPVALNAEIEAYTDSLGNQATSLTVEFEASLIQPLGRLKWDGGDSNFDDYETSYIIQVSEDDSFEDQLVLQSEFEYDVDYNGDVTGSGGKFSVTERPAGLDLDSAYYIRVLSKDNVKVNLSESNNVQPQTSFGLKTSSGSNLIIKTDTLDAPGNALYFPDNYPVSASINNYHVDETATSDFTIEMWLQVRDTENKVPVLTTKEIGNSASAGWALTVDKGTPYFELSDGSTSVTVNASSSIADGEWHHVAVIVDRTDASVEFYVDGAFSSSQSSVTLGSLASGASGLFFGQDTTGFYQFPFKGAMDEIRIWTSARTSSDIVSNIITPVAKDAAGLLNYYNCDLSSGQLVADLASQKNARLIGETFRSWVKSYAMGCPVIFAPNSVGKDSFNARWAGANSSSTADSYSLEAANNPTFFSDGNSVSVGGEVYSGTATSYVVSELPAVPTGNPGGSQTPVAISEGGSYFYRVTADYGNGVERTSAPFALSTAVDSFFPPKNSFDISEELTEFFTVPSRPEFESPEVTVTAWFRANRPEIGSTGHGTLLSNRDGSGNRYGIHVANDLSNILIWRGTALQHNVALESDRWYHLAAVMTSTDVTLYLNGEEVKYWSTGIPGPSGKPVNIGSSVNGADPFDGRIDEVSIWDHSLRRNEIVDNLNVELVGDESGLVGYYKFDNSDFGSDESVFLYLPDMSQNGADMLLKNGDIDTHTPWNTSAALGCPQVIRPANVTGSSMDARWWKALTVNPEPDNYLLYFSSNASFNSSSTDILSQSSDAAGSGLYQVPISRIARSDAERLGLISGKTYYYRVYTNVNGEDRWSEVMTTSTLFKTPGNAVKFNGSSQFIDLGVRSELASNKLGEFTIEAWVKPRKLATNGLISDETNKPLGGFIGGNFTNESNPTTPVLAVHEVDGIRWGFTNTNDQIEVRDVDDVFTEVRWYHVAFTFDGTNSKLYVDGKLTDSYSLPFSRPKSGQIRYLGKYYQNGAFYEGELDEVRIWNVAKNITEVRANVFRAIPKNEYSNLVAYLQFDQSNGLVTFDNIREDKVAELNGFAGIASRDYWVANDSDRVSDVNYNKVVFSFTDNYNVGLYEKSGKTKTPLADGTGGGAGLSLSNLSQVLDTDDFVYYGQALPYTTLDRHKTMGWGLGDPDLRSTQVTEQSWYIRSVGAADDATVDITFNMREISPEIYNYENYTGEKLTNFTNAEKDELIKRFTETNESDYQLLWNSKELISDNQLYRDVTPYLDGELDPSGSQSPDVKKYYKNIVLGKEFYIVLVQDLDGDDNPVAGTEKYFLVDYNGMTSGLAPGVTTTIDGTKYYLVAFQLAYDQDDDEFYNITFKDVPLRTLRSTSAYDGNYFALGMSLPLDDFILTPAIGLNSKVLVTEKGSEIRWTVEAEYGVTKYIVQRRNADGSWTNVEVVYVNETGEYYVLDSNYKPGDEYRIMVVDRFGAEQAFAAGKNVERHFVTLEKGWNLLSVPCSNVDSSKLDVAISGGYWKWENNSYVKVDQCPENLNGFWVHNPGSKVIVELTGKPMTDSSVNLESGWNIYGPVENCDVPPAVEVAYGWSKTTYDQIIKDYNVMLVTRGYWIFSLKDQTVKMEQN